MESHESRDQVNLNCHCLCPSPDERNSARPDSTAAVAAQDLGDTSTHVTEELRSSRSGRSAVAWTAIMHSARNVAFSATRFVHENARVVFQRSRLGVRLKSRCITPGPCGHRMHLDSARRHHRGCRAPSQANRIRTRRLRVARDRVVHATRSTLQSCCNGSRGSKACGGRSRRTPEVRTKIASGGSRIPGRSFRPRSWME